MHFFFFFSSFPWLLKNTQSTDRVYTIWFGVYILYPFEVYNINGGFVEWFCDQTRWTLSFHFLQMENRNTIELPRHSVWFIRARPHPYEQKERKGWIWECWCWWYMYMKSSTNKRRKGDGSVNREKNHTCLKKKRYYMIHAKTKDHHYYSYIPIIVYYYSV